METKAASIRRGTIHPWTIIRCDQFKIAPEPALTTGWPDQRPQRTSGMEQKQRTCISILINRITRHSHFDLVRSRESRTPTVKQWLKYRLYFDINDHIRTLSIEYERWGRYNRPHRCTCRMRVNRGSCLSFSSRSTNMDEIVQGRRRNSTEWPCQSKYPNLEIPLKSA